MRFHCYHRWTTQGTVWYGMVFTNFSISYILFSYDFCDILWLSNLNTVSYGYTIFHYLTIVLFPNFACSQIHSLSHRALTRRSTSSWMCSKTRRLMTTTNYSNGSITCSWIWATKTNASPTCSPHSLTRRRCRTLSAYSSTCYSSETMMSSG